MDLFAGIDLHSNNGYYAIINERRERKCHKRLPNDLSEVLAFLEPYKKDLKGIAIESTFNWYWEVDALMEHGYPVRLANPAGMQQYNGLKNLNDKTDAFFLAELLALGILPEGYVYPKEERPVRDVLRRRMMLVQQRTSHILSFESLLNRQTGTGITNREVKRLKEEEVKEYMEEEHLVLMGETNIATIRFLNERIKKLENAAVRRVKLKPGYRKLMSVPGIGKILALTIMLETGEIGRFPGAGNYASYCRNVKAQRRSNNKLKGKGNRKNGNKYLAWAFIEAANYATRFSPEARSYFQRKMAKTNRIVATKALASKLSKACYYIMRDQERFDKKKMFG